MRGLIDDGNEAAYARAASFRSYWAILLSRLGEPARAWGLMRREVEASRRAGRRIADSVLRTLVVMYDKIALNTQIAGAAPDDGEGAKAWRELTGVIEGALADGYFRADDGYNSILRRYFVVGRFAVARGGRANGVEKLNEDGPYPDGPKNHTRRGARLTEDDWAWMRIAPQLYLAYAQEFLDQDEYPEIYSPEAAKTMLENVARAVAKGTGLGSDVMGGDDLVKSSLTLAFVTNDLESFRGILRTVRDRDYSSLYDDAAVVFGSYCGLIPRAEFAPWIEAFHEAFAGRQHYFKAVYRALDKEHHDHGLALARATAGFFPEDRLLVDEAAYVESIVPRLKERKARRQAMEPLLEVAAAGMFRGFRGVRVLGEAERVFELRIKN